MSVKKLTKNAVVISIGELKVIIIIEMEITKASLTDTHVLVALLSFITTVLQKILIDSILCGSLVTNLYGYTWGTFALRALVNGQDERAEYNFGQRYSPSWNGN